MVQIKKIRALILSDEWLDMSLNPIETSPNLINRLILKLSIRYLDQF